MGLNPIFHSIISQRGAYAISVCTPTLFYNMTENRTFQKIVLCPARKSYFPEKCTFSRRSYLFPENRTCFSFFQKNVPIFRKSYNNPVPVITQRIQKIWLPEICTYFHFFRKLLL